jgi:hypothetical protein
MAAPWNPERGGLASGYYQKITTELVPRSWRIGRNRGCRAQREERNEKNRTCTEELSDREEQTAQRGIRAHFILNRKAFQGTQRKAQFSKK